jgi:hypothetical protein
MLGTLGGKLKAGGRGGEVVEVTKSPKRSVSETFLLRPGLGGVGGGGGDEFDNLGGVELEKRVVAVTEDVDGETPAGEADAKSPKSSSSSSAAFLSEPVTQKPSNVEILAGRWVEVKALVGVNPLNTANGSLSALDGMLP